MTVIMSETGVGHGWGTAPWKWVSGLTDAERAAVRAGEIVLISGCPLSGGSYGTTIRQVVIVNGYWVHRVPSDEILASVDEQGR
jgi:hypothetical protein